MKKDVSFWNLSKDTSSPTHDMANLSEVDKWTLMGAELSILPLLWGMKVKESFLAAGVWLEGWSYKQTYNASIIMRPGEEGKVGV